MKIRGFVVATKCKTTADFVEKYYMRADDTSIFVGIVEERVLGTECAFAILLADKSPVFAGICKVLEVYRDANNPYQRRGMRLGFRKLGVASEAVLGEMAVARDTSKRRLARGSTGTPVLDLEADGIPIELDDETSGSIPIELESELTSPTVLHD